MKKNEIILVISCDDNFIEPTSVMLKSISMTTNRPVKVYFLDGGINTASKHYFSQNFNHTNIILEFIKIPSSEFVGLKTNERIPLQTYYRLLIPNVLPNDIQKVIYLDGDLIVRSNIEELWNYEMSGKALLAVRDMWVGTQYVSSEKGVLSYKELNIPSKSFYFNAGVLVMDLTKWRKYNYSLKTLQYLKKYHNKVIYHDQDALNAILWDDWSKLPEEWNVMGIVFSEDDNLCCLDKKTKTYIRNNPKIVHFSGPYKPWTPFCNNPYQKEYLYLKNILNVSIRMDKYSETF